MDVLQIPSMLLKGNYKLKTLIHSPHWVSGVVSLRVSRAVAFLFDSAFLSALLPACVLQADILAWNTSSWNSTEAVCLPIPPYSPNISIKDSQVGLLWGFWIIREKKGVISCRQGKKIFLKKNQNTKQSVPDWFSFSRVRTRRDTPATECVKPRNSW